MILRRHEKFYIKSFIESFIVKQYKNIWEDGLLKQDSWENTSSWDLWDKKIANGKFCFPFTKNISNLKEYSFIKESLHNIVIVLHIGHDESKLEYSTLQNIIDMEYYIFEGVVIIHPTLALAFNHDGGILVCQKHFK